MLLRFPRDLHLRKRFFVLESFNHKARTNLYWLAWLVDHYTGEGSTILDPMGGAGSILFAAVKDRPVLTGDIEAHWCRLQGENARRLTTQTLFCTSMRICQWDAARLPLPNAIIPAIVTSPPYFDLFSNWNRTAGTEFDGPYMGETGNCYGFSQRQIGNFHIYEDYLKAMHQVYSEFWRILGQGGILVLIIGDKVHKGTIVPVTVDTMTLCRAIGFDVIARHERATIPSHFRRIHAQRDADYPLIDRETALVLQKQEARQLTKIAIVEIPTPDSLPGRQLFHKMLTYAECIADKVLVLSKDGFDPGDRQNVFSLTWNPNTFGPGDRARQRRERMYAVCREIVANHGLGAGDEVELHVGLRYSRYLEQRLNTLGARATIPTAHQHHNLGQKLAWYTNALAMLDHDPNTLDYRSPDETAFGPVIRPADETSFLPMSADGG